MHAPSPATNDEHQLETLGYHQELRRILPGFSNFAISFSLICILAGGITAFSAGLSSVGGAAVGIGWLVGGLFSVLVALSMGEIVSEFPTAGGLYYWSSALGGRGWGWVTAWLNLLGLIFVIASVDVGAFQLFRDLGLAGVFGVNVSAQSWQAGGSRWFVGTGVVLLSHTLLNNFGLKLTRRLTDLSGYLIFAVTVILAGAVIFYAPVPLDLSRLWQFHNFTGTAGGDVWPRHESMFVAFGLGMLLVTYTITGFDASAHMAEETENPSVNARRGIVNSVVLSVIFGYLLTCAFVLALPDIAVGASKGANAFSWMLSSSRMPTGLRYFLYFGIVLANYLCGLAGKVSCSRMMYAFARDGGLPFSRVISRVTKRTRTPAVAIWLSSALAMACTMYGGAFLVLAAGAAVLLYISYVMPIASALFSTNPRWVHRSYSLTLSRVAAVLAIIGGSILTLVGVQPPNQQVLYLLVAMATCLTIGWFVSERRRFPGPPAITQQEQALPVSQTTLRIP